MTEWQPIESAPKDGTEVLVVRYGKFIQIASWGVCQKQHDGYVAGFGKKTWRSHCKKYLAPDPTHWMPLPSAPEASQ